MMKLLLSLLLLVKLSFAYEKGNYDYNILALSWQAGFCKTKNYNKTECNEVKENDFAYENFVLHGLWPNKNDDPFSRYSDCTNSYVCEGEGHCWNNLPSLNLTDEYREKLSKYMPGVISNLHRHEWHKHGTCTQRTSKEYYDLSSKLVEEFSKSSFNKLISEKKSNSLTNEEIYKEFEKSFGKGSARTLKLKCSGHGKETYLTEIQFALKKQIDLAKPLSENIYKPEGSQFKGCGKDYHNVNILKLQSTSNEKSLPSNIKVASHNIKFLGYSNNRDNEGIAKMYAKHGIDLILIQELVAPPKPVQVLTKTIKQDLEVAEFFKAMKKEGYDYILSSEDTGTGDKIHINSSATEWFVAFYKKNKLSLIDSNFIAADRSNHDDFERVPHYFTFKTKNGMDFVTISTHLEHGNSKKNRQRRYHELNTIFNWINTQKLSFSEKDYIILGDMNVHDCNRLDKHLKNGFVRTTKECLNTNSRLTKPFDQVLYKPANTRVSNYEVINMFKEFNLSNTISNKELRNKYSDHHPIVFTIINENDD